jgi:hypothetical protein
MSENTCYCGRDFTDAEFGTIRQIIGDHPEEHRAGLSRLVCQQLRWLRPDGHLKEMSCRVAMLRMERDGLIVLPPPRHTNGYRKPYRRRTPEAEPELFPVTTPAGKLSELHLEPVVGTKDSQLWNEYIDRYHYLGYQQLPGAQLRYFAKAEGDILALFGFGAAAWKIAPRDHFIGWNDTRRREHLHLVINNARFLILPWVHSRNLASRLLGMVSRQIADDWQDQYTYRPVLLETFVEIPRFAGTCYKAANWICVGQTQGRGKLDRYKTAQLARKDIWLFPLGRDFRRVLCS